MLSDRVDFLDTFNPKALAASLANKLKLRRLAANISQQTLADKSGVSLGTIKRFEASHEISLKHLLMLAVSLQATEGFDGLFTNPPLSRMDDLIKIQDVKIRQRASRKK